LAITNKHRQRYEDNIDYGDDDNENQSDSIAFMQKTEVANDDAPKQAASEDGEKNK
jgi:hypothetical protein